MSESGFWRAVYSDSEVVDLKINTLVKNFSNVSGEYTNLQYWNRH